MNTYRTKDLELKILKSGLEMRGNERGDREAGERERKRRTGGVREREEIVKELMS